MTFFPFKQAPKPYLVSENRRYFHASERSCCPSTLTHISLSLCICSVSVQCAHIPPPPTSPSVCSVSVQRAHTHLSLSLRVCSVSVQHAHTHLSLSLSLSLYICSVSVQRAHTHYLSSLSLSLSLSLHLLSSCSACRREVQLIQLNTDIMLLASLIFHASIAEITTQLLSLSNVYLIS